MKHTRTALSLALSLAAGCTGGSSSDFDDVAADVTGIYRVSTYTHNDQACEPGGTSKLGTDGFAIATTHVIFGIHFLTVTSCASPDDCRQKQALIDGGTAIVPIQFSYAVQFVGAGGTLTGQGADTGFGSGGVCTDGAVSATTLSLTGTALRIEQAITIADDYAQDAQGFCSTDAAKAAASGNSCSELEVLTADFAEAL